MSFILAYSHNLVCNFYLTSSIALFIAVAISLLVYIFLIIWAVSPFHFLHQFPEDIMDELIQKLMELDQKENALVAERSEILKVFHPTLI